MADDTVFEQVEDGKKMGNDERLGYIINLLKPSLVENLTASHIGCLLHIKAVEKVLSSIHKKENSGDFIGAANDLLEAINNAVDEPGKWRMFVDALRMTEHTAALSTVLMEEQDVGSSSDWLIELNNRKLITVFADDTKKRLHLDELLPIFLEKGLVDKEEMRRLRAEIQRGNPWSANITFLLSVHRRHKDWYKELMEVLFADEIHRALVEEIDPMMYEKLMGMHRKDESPQPPGEATTPSSASAGSQDDQVSTGPRHSARGRLPLGHEDAEHTALSHASSNSVTVGFGEAAGSGTAVCGCGCCQQVKAELSKLRAEVASLKDLLMEAIKAK